MTETIIRWAVSAAFMVLAFIWGYREGQVKTLILHSKAMKDVEDGLLNIINDMYDRLNKYRDNEQEQKNARNN